MHLASSDSRVFVAGHRGLVGSAVLERLREAGYHDLLTRPREELDLRDADATLRFFDRERPEFVVLAAARVGGIMANARHPVSFLQDNLALQLNVIRAAHEVNVRRLIFLGSSCIYPRHAPQPMKEEHLLTGPLEPTNQWYAIAKIAGIKLCQAYRAQYRSDFVCLMPTNLYGPGDNFDLESSHVLPALIRKFHEAKSDAERPDRTVTLWGSGQPRREFLLSEDLADACVHVLECTEQELWDVATDGLLNVGVGEDLSILELAHLIREMVGSSAPIEFDRSKPDGTPRKLLDVSRMDRLGWRSTTPLSEGIRRTYAWFSEHEAIATS